MVQDAFTHVQLSAIKSAADVVAEGLKATKEKDKLIVSRAVFDIAAENREFDPAKLIAMAQERLTARYGWRFA